MAVAPKSKRLTLREKVELIVAQSACTYLEALTHHMNENNLTPARMAKSLCPHLVEKLHSELRSTKMVQTEVLDRFFNGGEIVMKKYEALQYRDVIQEQIEGKEMILKVIKEKKKRDQEVRKTSPRPKDLLEYEDRIELELKVLKDLFTLCSLIASE